MKSLFKFFLICSGYLVLTPQMLSSQSTAKISAGSLEVIQFHLQHRCYSCNKMEEYSRETLKEYSGVPFKLYNVEDKKNEKVAERFNASGTSLFLYNPKTGRIKDLTAGAFLSVGNKEKFMQELRKHIEEFQKSF